MEQTEMPPPIALGVLLGPDRGGDLHATIEQAVAADRQGFASVWLPDHLMEWRGPATTNGPPEALTLMGAIAALTERTRLGWAMLNPTFRNPAVLAKMLATLDQISSGRVIGSLGSGYFEAEYAAFDLPFVADHDARVAQTREIAQLLTRLWTTPDAEPVSFAGEHVRVTELAFNPLPVQAPHPPLWFGGDSDATLALVKELGDGWVSVQSGPERVAELRAAADWPQRPIDVAMVRSIFVADTAAEARAEAEQAYAAIQGPIAALYPSFDAYLAREVVGTAEGCAEQLAGLAGSGVTAVLSSFADAERQERAARLLLPLLTGGS